MPNKLYMYLTSASFSHLDKNGNEEIKIFNTLVPATDDKESEALFFGSEDVIDVIRKGYVLKTIATGYCKNSDLIKVLNSHGYKVIANE